MNQSLPIPRVGATLYAGLLTFAVVVLICIDSELLRKKSIGVGDTGHNVPHSRWTPSPRHSPPRAARGLFFSRKETPEDTKKYEERAADVAG